LKQHAHNPLDWYPWGPEALERARPMIAADGSTRLAGFVPLKLLDRKFSELPEWFSGFLASRGRMWWWKWCGSIVSLPSNAGNFFSVDRRGPKAPMVNAAKIVCVRVRDQVTLTGTVSYLILIAKSFFLFPPSPLPLEGRGDGGKELLAIAIPTPLI
jgi:hypothetical protein